MSRNGASTHINNCLSAQQVAFITHGQSITASSRSSRLIPSISRIIACKVSAERNLITLFLARNHGIQWLEDAKNSGSLAVVFSCPSNHETLQIKGDNVKEIAVETADIAILKGATAIFCEDLSSFGFNPLIGQALHHYEDPQLVAIEFTPTAVFEQSPGPNAGKPLEFAQ
jgi:hypothetical protein